MRGIIPSIIVILFLVAFAWSLTTVVRYSEISEDGYSKIEERIKAYPESIAYYNELYDNDNRITIAENMKFRDYINKIRLKNRKQAIQDLGK